MNESTMPPTFDPNRKAHAFARRFLAFAMLVAGVAVCIMLPASAQGQARRLAKPVEQERDVLVGRGAGAKANATKIQPVTTTVRTSVSSVVSAAGEVVKASAADATIRPAHMDGEFVTVMVEMTDPPAALVYADAMNAAIKVSGGSLSRMSPAARASATAAAVSQSKVQVSRIESAHLAILPRLQAYAPEGKVIFRTKSAYNGISMHVKRSQIAEIAALPGVKAVHIQIPKFHIAAQDIDFLNTRNAWTDITANSPFGAHGEGIKVADIDTGLDYVHTDFGGPGTAAAYASVSDKSAVPNPYYPTLKIPGGYDFAGDAYNGSNTPSPDPNPFDANGHGTGTASLIGGFGVNGDGSTYSGTYDGVTNLGSMKIAPGQAPMCFLYPLRVFGATGSTNLVTQALDWAVDPNGDGNISDHMDVVNMSLGANTGAADDPDCIAATNASLAGIIVCSAAGNAGDSYYIVSSPSVAPYTFSVAATFNNQNGFIFNANVTANSPAGIAGQKYLAIYGSPSPTVSAGGLTGNIVYANPPDGSTPLTNAAQVAGNICLIDRGNVSFVTKVQNAQAAGAVACVVVQSAAGSGTPYPITMGLDNTTNIPAMMIGLNDGNTIKANLAAGVNATLNNDNGFFSVASTAADTMPTYSSRGPRLVDSALKPEISAPAEVVGVAAIGTGSGVMSFNGTSSATPHVSGIMAILRQLHPTWSVMELLALATNTSTHDLFVGPTSGSGAQYGIGRVGAGRIDTGLASTANVIAFGTDLGFVNVSFGSVEVPIDSSFSATKNITLSNKGAADVTYNVSYVDVTPVTGATFTVGTGSQVTVTAGNTASVPVTFSASGNQLKHPRDASAVASLPSARAWLSEKGGYAVFTPTSGPEPTIRVALYATVKPVASMHATPQAVVPGANTGSFTLNLSGAPVNTGTVFNTVPQDIIGLVKPFELQYVSTQASSTNPPTDPNLIKYVGVTSDYLARGASTANTVIMFALEGFGNAATPDFFSSDKEIFISLDGGVTFAYAIFLTSSANGTANSNVYAPEIVNLNTSAGLLRFRTNAFTPTGSASSRDTNLYNNSVVTIPIMATDIGLAGAGMPTQFLYDVVTFDRSGNTVDDTGLLIYDLANPGLNGGGANLEPFFYTDLSSTTIPVSYNGTNFQNNGSLGTLVVHLHNGTGAHSDVVRFAHPNITNFSPSSGPVGTQVQISGNNFGPGTSVSFFNNVPATNVVVISSSTILANVPPGAQTGTIKVSNAAGTSGSRTKFTVTP
jgi:subtilisin family serine protease